MDERTNIPVMLEVANQRCVVVGGGPVGARRAKALADAQALVVVVAPDMEPTLIKLASEKPNIELIQRGFEFDDLKDAFLVVIASNSEQANGEARRSAIHHNVLMDGAHAKRGSDLTFMACDRQGPLTIAVHTDGASANAAKQIRASLVEHLDPAWPSILRLAAAAREPLYAIEDPGLRRKSMLQLVDPVAVEAYKAKGEAGLSSLYTQIIDQAFKADQSS